MSAGVLKAINDYWKVVGFIFLCGGFYAKVDSQAEAIQALKADRDRFSQFMAGQEERNKKIDEIYAVLILEPAKRRGGRRYGDR